MLLEVERLTKRYGSVVAVNQVSLRLGDGERVALLGPNGSGKTTLFNAISGSARSDGGRVRFDGTDVTRWSMHRLASHGLVRTFQHASVFPNLTVGRSVEIAASMTKRSRSNTKAGTVGDILATCALREQRDLLCSELSYGGARRLAVAVAMAANPKLLMLDEPAAGLNDVETAELRVALEALNERGVAVHQGDGAGDRHRAGVRDDRRDPRRPRRAPGLPRREVRRIGEDDARAQRDPLWLRQG